MLDPLTRRTDMRKTDGGGLDKVEPEVRGPDVYRSKFKRKKVLVSTRQTSDRHKGIKKKNRRKRFNQDGRTKETVEAALCSSGVGNLRRFQVSSQLQGQYYIMTLSFWARVQLLRFSAG